MMNTSANNKRIAKNTLLLYVRTLITMVISLYTSRVVLNALGVTDFGIYNVVGGVVAMFGFLNASMSVATQRFLNFELGRGNTHQLIKVFVTSVNIHLIISALVLFLGETIGLWFLLNKMTIPSDRLIAAMWVYQCAIFSTIILIVSVPYNALIIAHEKMGAFAYISILEVSLKLLAVFLLFLTQNDKLIIYSILMLIMQLIIRCIYGFYCKRHFHESKYHFILDNKLFKEMSSFAGWSLLGNIAFICFTQGLNILLNVFFSPVVNAARGISVQIQNAINQFSSSFQMALNPQITKSYATNDLSYMYNLIIRSSKFTLFLLLVLSVPVFLETPLILKIWLGIVPEYTVIFVRLMLCATIIDAVANPLVTAASATGRIRKYQIIVGGLLLLIIPISYIVLKSGGQPWRVFVVHIIICLCAFVARLLFVRKMIGLPLKDYCCEVVYKGFKILFILILFISIARFYVFDDFTIIGHLISDVVIMAFLCFLIYNLGLTINERNFINSKISLLLKNKK